MVIIERTFIRPLLLISLALLGGCSIQSPQKKQSLVLDSFWEFKEYGQEEWFSATVPGVVHLDLLNNQQIPLPFHGNNETELLWIEEKGWEYRCVFEQTKDQLARSHVQLVFEGLDTYATAYLNGQKILASDNMFIRWEVDVKGLLKEGSNELLVKFHSPLSVNKDKQGSMGYELPAGCETVANKVSPFTRKAPYHFGWDWGPRFVTSGIWKPVKLVYWDQTSIADALVSTKSIDDEKAELVCHVELKKGDLTEGMVLEMEGVGIVAVGNQMAYQIPFEMADPGLWWPNGMGEPHLYEKWLWLKRDGRVLDSVRVRFGVRTIELVNEPDSIGTSFYFVVNGIPLFVKGANYIPQDLFTTRVTDQQYHNLINGVKDAHMNMVRVWGGGIYEKDLFYDLCDENGILVWQDFMFAGSLYPANEQFMRSVAMEAEQQIKRLRPHPSLALWCGNNEIEVAWNNWGWQQQFGYSPEDSVRIWNDYLTIFHELIPSLVTEHGGGLDYVPTSPLSNWGKPENFNHSSMHYWGVWHGKEPFSSFKNNVGRFMVEYGFQSFPSASSLEGYIAPIDLDLRSQAMEQRQKSYIGNEMIFKHLHALFPEPTDFESFAWYSQLTQAVGLKKAIESHRLQKGHCMGTLYWQLNDCWPGPSWSTMDYLGHKKAAYHVVKDRYKTDILVVDTVGDAFSIWVISDRYTDWNGTVQIRLLSVAGKEIWVTSQPISMTAGSVKKVYNSHLNKMLDGSHKEEVFMELKLFEADDVLDEERFYFCPYKEVKGLDLKRLEL